MKSLSLSLQVLCPRAGFRHLFLHVVRHCAISFTLWYVCHCLFSSSSLVFCVVVFHFASFHLLSFVVNKVVYNNDKSHFATNYMNDWYWESLLETFGGGCVGRGWVDSVSVWECGQPRVKSPEAADGTWRPAQWGPRVTGWRNETETCGTGEGSTNRGRTGVTARTGWRGRGFQEDSWDKNCISDSSGCVCFMY